MLESNDEKAAKNRRILTTKSISQSHASRSLIDLYSDLMECRILFQRTLGHSQAQSWNQHSDEGAGDTSKINTAVLDSSSELLFNLSSARKALMNNVDKKDEGDAPLNLSLFQSSSFNNSADCQVDNSNKLDSIIKNDYERSKSQWVNVLNRRHADLRLHSGLTAKTGPKFKVIDQTFWEQVENTVNHDRLMDLASNKNSWGKKEKKGKDGDLTERSQLSFDDSKVYQYMLQDFIKQSAGKNAANGTAEAAAERLKLAMQKKSSKGKSDVDRRASKGRKISYVIHEKLTNFTFPIARPAPSIGEDILFKSMFGGVTASR